jgi:bacillithiol system protein YtxJ
MKGWIDLNTSEQFDTLIEKSKSETIVVFKHSTRCSISSMAERRLLGIDTSKENASLYYLDLIAHRSLSNYISEVLQETHESPQILIVKNGACTYDASHMEITSKEVIENL